MGMYFQDDFWEACSELPDADRDAVVAALVAYAFTGEAPALEGAPKALFIAFKGRVDLSIKRQRSAGKKKGKAEHGAKPGQTASKPGANAEQTASKTEANAEQNASKADDRLLKRERESEKEKKPSVSENTPYPSLPCGDAVEEERARFGADALAAFNEETGKDVRDLSPVAWMGLARIYDSGRSIDDVREVVRRKRAQWEGDGRMAAYLRPSTLFGPKFEEYLAEGEEAVDDVFAAYA